MILCLAVRQEHPQRPSEIVRTVLVSRGSHGLGVNVDDLLNTGHASITAEPVGMIRRRVFFGAVGSFVRLMPTHVTMS